MERDRRTSGMVVAPDLPGRCGWKKTLHRRHDEESSESAADPCHRRCSRKFRLLYGYGNRKWGNSGIDTIMRTLAEKRLIEDRAPTLDGSWIQRIMEARSANGNFVYSTMTPFLRSCGLIGMHGNACAGGIARLGAQNRNGAVEKFDRKIYLAVYYLGQKDLRQDLIAEDGILERLKRKVSRDDLYHTWSFNWRSQNGAAGELSQWNKAKIWHYLLAYDLLRVMVIVAGAGPHASGMPELQLLS